MKLIFDKPKQQSLRLRLVNYAIAALLLSVINILVINFISIGGITPDLLLILALWITLKEGRFTGLFVGFSIGLLFDLLSIDALIGTNALSKTVAVFIAGMFYSERNSERILSGMSFVYITFLCSIVHNLIYFFFYLRFSDISYLNFFLKYGLAMSVYTTVFATIAMLVKSTRKNF